MVGKFNISVSGQGNATEETVSLVQEYPIFSLNDSNSQKEFNEKVAFMIGQLMPAPTYVAPSVSLSNIPAIAEIGSAMTLPLRADFTQNDAGDISRLELVKGGTLLAQAVNKMLSHTDNFTVPNATLSYFARAIYQEGVAKQNSVGVVVENGRIPAGSIQTPAKTLKGVYPVFYGLIDPYQTISNVNVNALTKLVVDSSGAVTTPFDFVGKRMVVAIPKTAATKTSWFVTELNKGTIGNTGDLFPAPQELTFNSPQNFWNNVAYNIYISTPTNLKGTIRLQ